MKLSSFNANSFLGKVQSTTKLVESSTPQLILASTKDKFICNRALLGLMGVGAGDRLALLDRNIPTPGADNEKFEAFEERFLLTVNTGDPVRKGQLSKRGEFSYSVVWAAMLVNDPNKTEIKAEELIDMGLAETNGKSIIGKQKIIMDVERLVIEDEDGEQIDLFPVIAGADPQPVYVFTKVKTVAHDPSFNDDEDEDTEE